MPVSDLAIYSRAQAVGVFASSLFVGTALVYYLTAAGGNLVVSFIILPSLRRVSSPLERVSVWSFHYDVASKLMASLGMTAAAAFGTAAYYAPTIAVRNSMIVSSALSLSALPLTLLAIFPTVKALKTIESHKDPVVAEVEGDRLIEKWGKLSMIRWVLVAVGAVNGLKELSEWYAL